MKDLMQLEKNKILSVANQYRKDGYTVVLESNDMPAFLKDFQVDMVALSELDNVLIEVVSKATVKNRSKLENLAKLVQNKNKWRFEVIVTNPKEEIQNSISLQEIINRIEKSKLLLKSDQEFAAILIAWSSAEAVLRVLAENDDIKIKSHSPIQITKTLYSLGTIGPSAYEILIQAAKYRNLIAHGYQENSQSEDIGTLTHELLETISDLLRRLAVDIDDQKQQLSSEELIEWFYKRYEDPANGVPYDGKEGGYQYFNGGPYDPWEILADEFSWIDDEVIEEAAKGIYPNGHEWIEKGQY